MSATTPAARYLGQYAELFDAIVDNVEEVIQGKHDVVTFAVVCLLAEGHLLLEDVPGVGKTSLARALAQSISGSWKRLQFTPDLLPTDVTGVRVYNQKTHEFEFRPGGVFANIVVVDEVNRASPKTQSALLEVMEERRVSIESETHNVPRPFMVVATQNPIEMEGTYRLPEAQLDRFLMRLRVGYPDHADELDVITHHRRGSALDTLSAVVSIEDVASMIAVANDIHTSREIEDYVVRITRATRTMQGVRLGVSPRGSLALLRGSRAYAACEGRDYVVPDDVRLLAMAVLPHRLLLTPEAELQGWTPEQLVEQTLKNEIVPQSRGAQ